MDEIGVYWAITYRKNELLFAEYEALLREDRLTPIDHNNVIQQQRFGQDNVTCLSLSEMEENGWQASNDQDAFRDAAGQFSDDSLNVRLLVALADITTPRRMRAAVNLMLGQATNADHCALRGLRKQFKDMTWPEIVGVLTAHFDCMTTDK